MVGELIADRYELEQLIGAGGMSSVYRARDRLLERHVALKILRDSHLDDADSIERFRREARAVAQLSHPNIVTVIDRGEDDGRHFIVFEHVDGRNLKQLVQDEGALPVRRALELAIEVGLGLACAHEHGVVHRDVKPQNVLLNGDGKAKVTDFGIARSLDVDRGVTQTGTVLGTSNYIAPEQASGRPVSAQTDVYSLGVVLYELLTGEVPFPGDNFVAVALRHMNEQPPSVLERRPETPLRVAGAVERALAKDPAERFPTMHAFVDELRACLAELGEAPDRDATAIVPPRVVRESRRRRAGRRRRVGPLLLLGAGLAAIAAAVGVALLSDRGVDVPAVGDEAASAPREPITLAAAGTYDPPPGDRSEHDDEVGNAVDGDPATYWTTSSYRYPNGELGKDGVGIVLDAGKPVSPRELVVRTDTPGFTAEIRAGARPDGGFEQVADARRVAEAARFPVADAAKARYWLVWITNRGDHAAVHVNDVEAK